jgi:hypothetical protein
MSVTGTDLEAKYGNEQVTIREIVGSRPKSIRAEGCDAQGSAKRLGTMRLRISVTGRQLSGTRRRLGFKKVPPCTEDMPHLTQSAGVMLDELAWWVKALKVAREA